MTSEFTSLLQLTGQIPLVIAFVYFALRIIHYYLEDQKASREATGRMITKLIEDWQASQKERNEDMKGFLSDLQERNDRSIQRMEARIEQVTQGYEASLETITARNEVALKALTDQVGHCSEALLQIGAMFSEGKRKP